MPRDTLLYIDNFAGIYDDSLCFTQFCFLAFTTQRQLLIFSAHDLTYNVYRGDL